MRMPLLSPTLIALVAAVGWGRADAATAAERDAHFEAVRALIDAEVRAPAERQKAEFLAAGYPDVSWCQKFLEWDFADRFHTVDPKQVDTMGKELTEAVDKDPSVPEVVKTAFKAGGGTYLRLINELAVSINPDDPPSLAGKEAIPAEEKARRDLLVKNIIAYAEKEWNDASAKVKEFENGDEQTLWNLPETDPKYKAMALKASLLRFDAIKVLYQAHIVLREVITRGPEFGIDPAPASQFFQVLLKQHKDWIGKWDYDWGDSFLPLKAYCNVVLGEAVRQKLSGIAPDDVDGELGKVTDADLKEFKGPVRDQLIELQLSTFANILRWRLELGDDKNYKRGLETFDQIRERVKDGSVKLNGSDAKARTLAQCFILAARLQAAKKDMVASTGLLAEVMKYPANPMAQNAKNWMAYLNRGSAGGSSEWSVPPVADDPDKVVAVAKAFIGQAGRTEDLKQSRALYLRAAVALRNGVLGLTNSAYDDQFVRNCPEVYYYYAYTLYKLDMHFHAAIAAEEGLRAIASRITDRSNPWRKNGDPKKDWSDDGANVQKLARASINFASALFSRAQGTGVQGLYDDAITLVKKVSPEDAGKGLEKNQIVFKMNEGEFDGAIELAKKFADTYKDSPDDYYWAFGLMVDARERKIEALDKRADTDSGAKSEMDKTSSELTGACDKMRGYLEGEAQKRKLSPIEQKALGSAMTGPVFILNKSGKYAEVIKALNKDWWKNPPADEGLAARMLKSLCIAVAKQQEEALKDPKARQDPQTYLAAFPTQDSVYRDIYAHQIQRYKEEDAKKTAEDGGRMLAVVFKNVVNNGEKLAGQPGGDKLAPIIEEAKKGLADVLYPELDEDTNPALLLAMGGLLWGMDDHARGGQLYEWYMKAVANDAMVQGFRRNPKAKLDEVEGIVASRPELKGDWAKLRTLLEDTDDLKKGRAAGLPKEQWGSDQDPIDYVKAAIELRKYRKKIDDARTLIGSDAYKKISEALDDFEKLVTALAQDIKVKKALASWYRESGRSDDARRLYQWLIDYDPDDPDSAVALVENVLEDLRSGKNVPEAQITKARDISINLREDQGKDPFIFWSAQIQIFELSAALHDLESINRSLKLLRASGDISHDLVQAPVRADAKIKGDDFHVRRAKNALAEQLANRFLKVYEFQGVTDKPGFRIDHVSAGGKNWTIFVDAGYPAIVGTEVENAEGDPVVVFRPEGDSPLKDAADAPKDEAPKADAPKDKPAEQPKPEGGAK